MPFVRIELSDASPETLGPAIGDVIYQAMTETINVPKDDKFQVITRHAAPVSYTHLTLPTILRV